MLVVKPVPRGTLGFDTATKLTPALAAKFRGIGYRFVLRPLSIGIGADPGDLDATEVRDITTAGLGLMWYQHVRYPGWSPTGAMGRMDATNAVAHAQAAGIPAGISGWCDLEGVSESAGARDIMDYLRAWHDVVAHAGYVPGLYVGANSGLDAAQLGQAPFNRCWESCSRVPDVAGRGYVMHQVRCDFGVFGVQIDRDETQANRQGELPIMLVDCEAYLAAMEREGDN